MALGFWQIAVIVVLFLLLFGRGKIPQLMTDVAQGIKGFRQGMREEIPATQKDDHLTPADPVINASPIMHNDKNQ